MKRTMYLRLAAVAFLTMIARSGACDPVARDVETARRTQWFRDAKFGMFIHWGLYAIPAGEWNGRPVPKIGEWIMHNAKIPVRDYEQLAARFNPVKFNADQWVQLAEDAGMKYMTITSKHHDGFALFGSTISPYNIVDATPFKRDAIKELADACRRRCMPLGFYYSQSQDWHHPGGAAEGGHWDKAQDGDYDAYLRTVAEPQVKELLTRYAPVALIWFDTPMNMTDQRAGRFVNMVRELQPNCLINGRLRSDRFGFDYASMRDNQIPAGGVAGDWETPATLNDTWGFKKNDHNWKSPKVIIHKLADIASKGGNYLLNVGPTAEGVIPSESQDILRTVGRWLKTNGEAIYGTGPTPFGEEFGTPVSGKDAYGRPVKLSSLADWRCTTKPGKLYIHFLKWPGSSFTLKGLKSKVTDAFMLAALERKLLAVKQDGSALTITMPEKATDPFDSVLCLTHHIGIDCDYPGENIRVEAIGDDVVRLRPDYRDTQGRWFYWNFRVRGAEGKTVRFEFVDGEPVGVCGPAVSIDSGKTWQWLGAKAGDTKSFGYHFAPQADEVRFAFAIPYQQADWQRFLQSRKGTPWMREEVLCKSRHGRDVECLDFGCLDRPPAARVVLTCRHHCCECLASYALEGLIGNVLDQAGDEGKWLASNVEFFAVPFVDKDGVEEGDQGKNRKPRDHGRDYEGPSLYPETKAIRQRLPKWLDGKPAVAIDLHCPWIRGPHNQEIYIVGSSDQRNWAQQQRFGTLLEQVAKGRLPYRAVDNLPFGKAWNTQGNYTGGRGFGAWAAGLPEVRLAASFEIPYADVRGTEVNPDAARSFGRDLARALYRYLSPAPATGGSR